MDTPNVAQPPLTSQQTKSATQYQKLLPNLQLTKRFLDKFNYTRTTIQLLPAKTGKFPRYKGNILLNGSKGSSACCLDGSLSVERHMAIVNDLIKFQQEQMGVFFMVNEGDGEVHPGKETCRSSASVTELKACFVDTDTGDVDKLYDFCKSVGIQPHLVVESSPGRYHVYFLLQLTFRHDADALRKWREIQRVFMSLDSGFDQSMGDIGKLLRLPGFYHNKTDVPFLVEINKENFHPKYDLTELYNVVCLGEKEKERKRFSDLPGHLLEKHQLHEKIFVHCDAPYALPAEKVVEGGRHQAIASYLSYLSNFTLAESKLWEKLADFCVKYIDEPERFLTGDRLAETARLVQYYIDARRVEEKEKTAATLGSVTELPVVMNGQSGKGNEGNGKSLPLGDGEVSPESLDPEEKDNLGLPKINYVDHPEEVASRFVGKRLRHHGFIPQRLIYTNGAYFIRHNNYWKEIPNDEKNHLGQLCREFIEDNKYNYLETKSSKKMRAAAEAAGEPLPPKKLYAEKNFRPRDVDAVRVCAKESCVYDGTPNKWFLSSKNERQPDVIAVRNGLLDIRTGQLLAHTHEFFNTGILPCAYEPGVISSLWQSALVDWFGSGQEGKSAARELQLWFGYLLLSSIQLKNIACFQGPRNCGKSTVVKVASILLGADYTLNRRQQDLSGDFGFAGLDKCKLLFFEEFHLESITPTQVQALKTLTSLNSIQINQKFRPAYTAENMSRIMIATNSEPGNFRDPQGALADRFLFWIFRQPKKVDKLFLSKLTTELSGVLNWAVRGAQLLLENNGDINQPIGIHETMKKTFEDSGKDPVSKFVEDCCSFDETAAFISYNDIGEIFDRYLMTQSLTKEETAGLSFARLSVKTRFCNSLLKNCSSVKHTRTKTQRGFEFLKIISDLDSVGKIPE